MSTFIKGVNSIELFSIGGAGLISFLIGDWSVLMAVLLTMQGIDIASGFMKGKRAEDIGSKSFFSGIKKKAGMWMLIIVANMIDKTAFGGTPVAVTGLLGYLIAGEGISITENLAALGVPIPQFITKYLSQLRDESDVTDLPTKKEESNDSK